MMFRAGMLHETITNVCITEGASTQMGTMLYCYLVTELQGLYNNESYLGLCNTYEI